MLKKLFKTVLIFLAVYTILGFFILPAILRIMVEKELSENLRRNVTVNKIYINPYAQRGRLGISSDQFLKQHTISAFRDKKYFPSLMLYLERPQITVFRWP